MKPEKKKIREKTTNTIRKSQHREEKKKKLMATAHFLCFVVVSFHSIKYNEMDIIYTKNEIEGMR